MRSCFSVIVLVAGLPLKSDVGGSVIAVLTTWELPAPVYRTVAVVSSGHIFVLGGHDSAGGTVTTVYRLDPRTGKSAMAGSLALETHGSAAALVGRRILVFGGASLVVHDTIQAFNPTNGKSTVIGHLPVPLADTTAASVGRETVLIGGFSGAGPQTDVWGTSNGTSFRIVAQLPQAVRYPAVAALGADVYVFGGLVTGGEYNGLFTADIQRVDLSTGRAGVVGHLPAPLAHGMAAEMGGHLYLMGGSTASGTSSSILLFDRANGSLSSVGKLPEPVTDAAVATVGLATYVLGGISTTGPVESVTRVQLKP